jgi:hypothetical protein
VTARARFLAAIGLALALAAPAAAGEAPEWTEAALRKLAGAGFDVFAVGPTIFATDDGRNADLRSTAAEAVRLRGLIAAEYSKADTRRAIGVFLLATGPSYAATVQRIAGSAPFGPGMTVKPKRLVFVNASEGALGCLLHELVHVLVADDWGKREPPVWFDEGFASLFGWPIQDGERVLGGIPAALGAFKDRKSPPLAISALIAAPKAAFAGSETVRHYGTARLLCAFLQDRALLAPFYRSFRDASKDATGAATLEKLCGAKLSNIDKDFADWTARKLEEAK